jgi:hypothetical protein
MKCRVCGSRMKWYDPGCKLEAKLDGYYSISRIIFLIVTESGLRLCLQIQKTCSASISK